MNIRAYLDNNATTQVAPEVLAAMLPYLTDHYLNPSSVAGEVFGMSNPVADAKRALARLFGSVDLAPSFVLTSGATEANSWAVHAATARDGAHLVATAIEHPSLLAALQAAAARGATVDLVPPNRHGQVDVDRFLSAVRRNTAFVSFMAANNETGVSQPISELANAVRSVAPGALVHVDATQAVGRLELSLADELQEIDLLSLSAHKFHGPKGIGALFIRQGVNLRPLIHGGQEEGRRGGTPNPSGAAGLAVAADLACDALPRSRTVAALRDQFETLLRELIPHAIINGVKVARLPNTSSITIQDLDATAAVEQLAQDGICIASGAACTGGSPAPSHVLVAMGLDHSLAKSTLRFSLSRNSTLREVKLAVAAIGQLLP